LAETWWLGLRLAEGVDPERARSRAGCQALGDGDDPALEVAERLVSSGHLDRRGAHFVIPHDAVPLADAIAARFLNDVPRSPRAARARAHGLAEEPISDVAL
jgi:hypothetical protein